MSVGAFSGIVMVMAGCCNGLCRWQTRRCCLAAGHADGRRMRQRIAGVLIGIPVLRLRGDYLAIVTLAFGEIIRNVINCLYFRGQ